MLCIKEKYFANDTSYPCHPSLVQHLLVFMTSATLTYWCYHLFSVTNIMTKVKACVQSHMGAYRPTCYKEGLYLCASCVHSLAIYRLTSNFQAFKERFKKFKLQRHAAMQVDLTHAGMGSGLAMARTALWAEFHELVLQLNGIEKTNSALYARLMTEARMRSVLVVEATSTDMARHCPPSPHI